jgi:transposase-like protein
VALAISDCHAGLRDAIAATLPGATWQRCRTHYAPNLATKVPKSAQPWVMTLFRAIFGQPDADQVHAQFARVVDALIEKLPDAAEHLDAARANLLAFTAFPREVWRQIWSNNPLKRLNREIRRRTDVAGIFPDRAAVIRLVGAVLIENDLRLEDEAGLRASALVNRWLRELPASGAPTRSPGWRPRGTSGWATSTTSRSCFRVRRLWRRRSRRSRRFDQGGCDLAG